MGVAIVNAVNQQFMVVPSSAVSTMRNTRLSEVSCKTENLIYLLTCECKLQYVGQTKTAFNLRINNHRSFYNNKRNCPLTRHLVSTGHSFENIRFQIIETNQHWDDATRDAREMFWIHQLCVLEPNGLNERDQMSFKKKGK